ncbi:hypothetical protein PHYBLDRAFT_184570 [Phycomyces blakesleeanus NRRL 1555(-)]|uniref:Uncharacterized protein n=1 Tax=Phycomyces blakesleeanus (strain ATCC 8743b / DSM 1359 / FGSC 10004 / NBRC 33097 / NRRL 1555) TaxID=763407 RepID=A0A167QN73_PHYB8|nr:hypothetical protein PHYBLDRAFT_184960 [Phycomyces blakesleeanus NRRL 1555(-)]XP_018298000.1 hypothetical protein PHYBLDRAFT_184999 [Phycomyces blakesleeanus NRRL 1555(-)]XP_018299270.1 hypothetical protein PHYBLDRAFT_184570 [Phycomyces blakesleeanus NRRL 1555(-)]OAD79870.1 hypothetical protein PHYBLDRAFT_184960 [Phycomyces blakesleeanus NRRL 1555(-)]OAD79960.1 hypothetical protein PHYBLDRAFT_184999 [Phycomyces blakesleeanus NRRL 1555(-)]OAD81230.1 hypothetical protein PHYBLDRAFT_184570 [Ph|eukprot:XP_018297910.1 hypothetical protein PHYBLDRAFT_184960 [Phycomyces blakesleeanus NRRL 1555(-)]
MIDTGSSRTFINLKCLNNNLQITKINSSIGSFNFLSKNSSTKRLGKTDPLNFKYINGITFKHAPEVLEFNTGFNFDILLGRDILAKMNIGLINVAYDIEGEYVHSDNAKDYAAIYENLNIDKEKKFEPDNSPAGTAQQRAEFMSSIKASLEENKNIPVESYCPLSESIIRLPTKEGATAYRRQYPIPHALRPTLDKQLCINRHIPQKTLSAPFSLMYARRVNVPDEYGDKDKYSLPKATVTIDELEKQIDHMKNIIFPAINEPEFTV